MVSVDWHLQNSKSQLGIQKEIPVLYIFKFNKWLWFLILLIMKMCLSCSPKYFYLPTKVVSWTWLNKSPAWPNRVLALCTGVAISASQCLHGSLVLPSSSIPRWLVWGEQVMPTVNSTLLLPRTPVWLARTFASGQDSLAYKMGWECTQGTQL